MSSPRPAQLLRRISSSLAPVDDEALLNGHHELDGGSLPFGTSTDLLASLDPYDGDVAGWLNDLLDDAPEDEAGKQANEIDLVGLDSNVRTLLGRLSGISQDTSAQLEQTIHDISRTVPRLTYDLQFMRESAASLRLSLHTVESKTASTPSSFSPSNEHAPDGQTDRPDEETLAVLERLTYLDKVKTGMESTLAVLQEAESWSSLESEFTALLADGLYSKAASRLSEASKSVSVFTHNTTEYESRRSLLLSLQNQLETSLVANLVKAINEKDKDACKSFFGIFGMIQREGEFRGYYYGSRRGPVVEMWDKARLSDCGETSRSGRGSLDLDMAKSSSQESTQSSALGPPIPLNTFLPQFYKALVNLVAEERALLPTIFPDPQPTLSTFLITIFDALTPSLPQRLESLVEFQGATALTELIKAFKATEELAVGVQSTMDKLGFSSSVFATSPLAASPGAVPGANGLSAAATASAEDAKSSRRDSRRFSRRLTAFSISVPRLESLDSNGGGTGGPWENALFEPFLDFQSEYAALESRLLASQLDREIGPSGSSFGGAEGEDSARIVWERSIAVFGMAEGALDRCLAFTHGYGAVGLVGAINEVFGSFLKRCGVLFKDAAAKSKRGADKSRRSSQDDFDLDDLDDLDGMDYSSEDWGTFQLALHLLGACRAIQERLASFESKLLLSLHQVAQGFFASRDDPSGLFVSGTTRGAISLLQQSSLNSRDLHDLLERLPSHTAASASHLKAPSFFPPAPPATPHTPHSFGQGPSTTTSTSPSVPHLLDPSRKSLTDFTISTQLFLSQTILSPLHTLLTTYPALPIWTQPAPVPSKKANALVVPTFSLDPSQIISRIGEGLLNLPRLFEVSVKDDALAFSIETLPFIDLDALRELREDSQAEAAASSAEASRARSGSLTAAAPVSPGGVSPGSSPKPPHPTLPPAPGHSAALAPLSPETITSLHLSSLTLSLLSHLTTIVLPALPTPLSSQGAAQLASDLGYLVNVVRALDVDWAEGEEWREGMEVKEADEWRAKLKEGGGSGSAATAVWEKVGGMRGWKE